FKFLPETLEVAAGTEVTWSNSDIVLHTVVADDGSFESDNIVRGDTFSFTFERAGSFPYICGVHTSMKGEIVVT
ncbi:MAG: cupredoxin domain-containing protein, partial [Chloroflexia bacterium]|nr:cupredoxin domain-containing protein [Chloroflexia bacterium]